MHDSPSAKELISAVKAFLDTTAQPALKGHAAFHARVASNALAIVLRELEQRPQSEAAEAKRLESLLGVTGETPAAMNRLLCKAIREGRMDQTTPGLIEHLKTTTIAQLSIDQPGYSGLPGATSEGFSKE
jgi:hypothetical protein